jgi:hypothetical protein|nr:MAG TPA: hypothetical protein [Caudoviricetes sp.]
MLNYIEYLNVPSQIAIALIAVLFVLQLIGEFLNFKGKAVPEIMSIRKYFARKKSERKVIRELPNTIQDLKNIVNNIDKHYNTDNISMRDKWIDSVNNKLMMEDKLVRDLDKKLDEANKDIVSILVDNKRDTIIDFASRVSNSSVLVTKEQFNRVFKLYKEYEDLISKNGLTNGEVDIAYRIIVESYEEHLSNHTFIEDTRGW